MCNSSQVLKLPLTEANGLAYFPDTEGQVERSDMISGIYFTPCNTASNVHQ